MGETVIQWWRKLSPVGKVCSFIILLSGAIVGVSEAWPVIEPIVPPTSREMRHYVQAQNQVLKNDVNDLKMQANTARRDSYRAQQFDRQQDVKKDPTNYDAQRRLDEVTDELTKIERARDDLGKERGR